MPNSKNQAYPVPTPHDAYFAQSLSDLVVARDFLEQHLPQPLAEVLDLSTLTLCKDRFVDEELRSSYTDMVYCLQLKDHPQDVYIATLIEHQSTPQAGMPVRALQYEYGIIRHHWDNHGVIPLVYTMVYYNGKERWNYPTDLRAMINAPADLIDRYAFKPFQLIQLNSIPDEILRGHLWSGVVNLAMKHIFDRDILPALEETILDMLWQIQEQGKEELCTKSLYYIFNVGEVSDEKAFFELVRSKLSNETGEKVMSLAQQYREEGLAEGVQRGLRKGMEKGIEQGQLTIANTMLNQGVSPEIIAQFTGLPMARIQSLTKAGKIELT